MGRTLIRTTEIENEGVRRDDLNVSTVGQAVIRKIVAGSSISINSTGADAGTGDVTVNTVQNIRTTDSPTFAGLTITAKLSLGVTTNDSAGITPLFYGGADGAASGYLDGAGGPAIYHGRRAGGTQASRSNVSNGQAILEIRSAAYSGATGYWDTAKIAVVVDGNVTDNQRPPTRLEFYTNAANGAVTKQLTLDAAGNLFPSAGQNLGSATKKWGNFYMEGAQVIVKRADTGSPTQDSDAHIFIYDSVGNGYYLVIKWNDAGTVRYRYMRLDGTGATWTYSTTLP